MSKFISKIGEIVKVFFEALISLTKYIFEAIKNLIEKNQVGEKINKFTEESGEKIQSGLENVKKEQQARENQNLPKNVNITKLGQFLDGWAELVEGMGEKAGQVRQDTLEQLELKEMPDINLAERVAHNKTYSEKRDYIFSNTSPGATTAIYIAQHGKDLYVSWRTWLAPVLNKVLLLILFLISVLLGYSTFGTRQQYGGSLFNSYSYSETWVEGWLAATLGFLILGSFLIMMVGKILKDDPLAFFFIEPNVFDAEDITAMSLSAHYAILRSLDHSGIDTSKLRLKEKFTGGRKGEDV